MPQDHPAEPGDGGVRLPNSIQEPVLVNDLYADPYHITTDEILEHRPAAAAALPAEGECFHYAHTNFVILGKVISQVTGKPLKALLQRDPAPTRPPQNLHLGTAGDAGPYLNAYTSARGPYEDSTAWTPSWGISSSMTMSSTIGDIVKSETRWAGERWSPRGLQRSASRHTPQTCRLCPLVPFSIKTCTTGSA